MTADEALNKAMKLCSTKEYAPFEIGQKLISWGLEEEHVPTVIETLKTEKFLDEFRMARYFANDRLRFYKWGKIKIKYSLQQKKVNPAAISEALEQIDELEYVNILQNELIKKRKSIKDTDEYKVKGKLFQFGSARGFEADTIYKMLEKIVRV